jgi:hypothetical protein
LINFFIIILFQLKSEVAYLRETILRKIFCKMSRKNSTKFEESLARCSKISCNPIEKSSKNKSDSPKKASISTRIDLTSNLAPECLSPEKKTEESNWSPQFTYFVQNELLIQNDKLEIPSLEIIQDFLKESSPLSMKSKPESSIKNLESFILLSKESLSYRFSKKPSPKSSISSSESIKNTHDSIKIATITKLKSKDFDFFEPKSSQKLNILDDHELQFSKKKSSKEIFSHDLAPNEHYLGKSMTPLESQPKLPSSDQKINISTKEFLQKHSLITNIETPVARKFPNSPEDIIDKTSTTQDSECLTIGDIIKEELERQRRSASNLKFSSKPSNSKKKIIPKRLSKDKTKESTKIPTQIPAKESKKKSTKDPPKRSTRCINPSTCEFSTNTALKTKTELNPIAYKKSSPTDPNLWQDWYSFEPKLDKKIVLSDDEGWMPDTKITFVDEESDSEEIEVV